MTEIMTQISTQIWPTTDMYYSDDSDQMIQDDQLIEMDQCLIEEERDTSINPTWHWNKKEAIQDGVNLGYRDQCIVARDTPNGKK
jgi:hypothetical protein